MRKLMIYEKIQLTDDSEVYLETYVSPKIGNYVRDAILVIPGGGYGNVSDREGEPIAEAFMPLGFNAFVLHYSVGRKKPYPAQLIEASLAMKHIKDNAEKYNINPDRVFVVGFSAGGHLAGSVGTFWHRKEVYDAIDMPFGYNKPKGMMLIYPVLNDHSGSFQNLLCLDNPTEEEKAIVDIVKGVDKNTVPAFLMHTSNDPVVPIHNSIDMANKLASLGAEFELHIYPDGPHGIALANEITEGGWGNSKMINTAVSKWVEQAAFWAKSIK